MTMFKEYMTEIDKNLDDVFTTATFETKQPDSKIRNRPEKPSYSVDQLKATRPKRESFGHLIFDAFGSTVNSGDFVLLRSDINSYKERLWSMTDPMNNDRFTIAWDHAMKGAVPSNDYMSAIRLVKTILIFSSYLC
jgi:hypothetical protein